MVEHRTTAEDERKAPDLTDIERYHAEHVQLPTGQEGFSMVALQGALNKGARKSRRLVGLTQDPTGRGGLILVWDTAGFISG